MQKLLLIDGTALLYRGFFAIPPYLKTSKGELLNAVFGVSSMLLSLYTREKPHYIAVAFDCKEKTFRHLEFKDYKATRPAPPAGLHEQLPFLKEVLQAFGAGIFEKPGYEADDVLATLTTEALTHEGLEILIATGDMDVLQLVRDRVAIITPQKGFNETKIYNTAAVLEKFGLHPRQMIDYKSLRGDVSDNVPGVYGIGEKIAAGLLQKYDNLENIYENLSKISGSVGEKLKKGKDMAFFSKKMVTLITDVPIEFKLKKCSVNYIDWGRVIEVFEKFEFASLVKKIQQNFKVIDEKQGVLF